MIEEERPTTRDITSINIESFWEYLKTESRIFLLYNNSYDVVKHFSGGYFQILERTEDFSRARAIADFHTLGSNNIPTIIYDPHGEPIYLGEDVTFFVKPN